MNGRLLTRLLTRVLVLACLFAPVARGAAVNPTGRTLELQVPLVLNRQPVGSLLLSIAPDDAMSLDAAGLAALLGERLEPGVLDAMRQASVDGRLTPRAMTAAGVPTRFDSVSLSLVLDAPGQALRRRGVSLDPVGTRRPAGIDAERFSGFINLGFAVLHDRRERGGFEREDTTRFRLEMDGLVRLNGPVIAYEAVQTVDLDGTASAARRSTALLLDAPSRRLRATIGDQTYLGRGLQRSVTLLGVGIGRDFALGSGDGVRVTGRRSIDLARASRVEVRVGQRLLGSFDLQPGSYDFEDIPLTVGANDVVLRVQDDTGKVELIEFTELFDSALLPVGQYDFGMGLGIRSRLGETGPDYLEDSPVASGHVRRGFGGGSTYGANLEATDTVQRLGVEWLRATRLGALELLGAVSSGTGTGYAVGAEFATVPNTGTPLGAGRLDVRIVARSTAFIEAGDELASGTFVPILLTRDEIDVQGTDLSVALGYATSLSSGVTLGAGSTLVRRAGAADTSTSLALSGRWQRHPRLGWAARLRYVSRGPGPDTHDLQLGLVWQIDRHARVSIDHATGDSATTLDYARNVGSASVGAYGVGIAATHVPRERTDLDLQLTGTFNRFDAFASWRGSRDDVIRDDRGIDDETGVNAQDAGSAVLRFDTAIGFAGRSAAVGRRIDDGFAIVRAHPALDARPVLINARDDRHDARTSGFGPALVRSPPRYRPGTIRYRVDDLPLGYDIGSGTFDLQAPFGAGYRLQVGSAARVTVVGTLLDGEDGTPLGLVTGKALPSSDGGGDPVPFFSSRTGRFAIPGLLPGDYEIVLDTVPERRTTLVIPEDADSLFRVPGFAIP